jgi:dsRNA-specific ribonuclease
MPGLSMSSGGESLGVLTRCGVKPLPDRSPALLCLAVAGLHEPSSDLRRALAVGLMHRSYLYEHRDEFRGLTPGALSTLEFVGQSFVGRELASIGYPAFAADAVGKFSTQVAGVRAKMASWAGEQAWLRQSSLVSAGLADAPVLPPKAVAALLTQTVGVLYLDGRADVARSLVSGLTETVMGRPAPEWRGILARQLQGLQLAQRATPQGPDHAQTFKVLLQDSAGRSAEGSGPNKRTAASAASFEFLRSHYPRAVEQAYAAGPTGAGRPTATLPENDKHRQVVVQLQNLFDLPDRDRPLLCQALLHSSWCYENRQWIVPAKQRDNSTLAFLGSWVLQLESARAQAMRTLQAPRKDLGVKTLPNAWAVEAFEQTGVAPGLLMAKGQARQGLTPEIAATAFQALIGAVYVAKHYPDTMEPAWPARWADSWHTLTADTSDLDPTSALQRWCSAASLELAFKEVVLGADNERRFWSTVTISSQALDREEHLQGHVPGTSKTRGRHEAAARASRIIDILAQPKPSPALSELSPQDLVLARFLLHHLLCQTGAGVPVSWRDRRILGLHLAGAPRTLVEWAVDVDEFHECDPAESFGSDKLASLYHRAYEVSAAPTARTPDEELAVVLDLIDDVEGPAGIDAALQRRLKVLCDLYRVHGSEQEPVRWSELISEWQFFHRDRIAIADRGPQTDATLAPRDRAVLDAAMEEVLRGAAQVTVKAVNAHPLEVILRAVGEGSGGSPESLERFCTLWSQVTPTARVAPTADGLWVTISYPDVPVRPGPFTAAALQLLRPTAEPLAQSIADLLHDIKNQVSAARTADALPSATRTGQLRNQLTASEHLDQAQAAAKQLRAASALWEDDTSHALELGSFLHTFSGAVLVDAPKTVSVNGPQAHAEAHVDISEAALRSVLNNLVKNAFEAMSNAGVLTIAWSTQTDEATILIGDDGPGLPSEVAMALVDGSRIRSTKPGGNGLGLLGAQALLNRRGGQLAPAPCDSGTTWKITLPLTTPDPTETS